MGGLATAMVVGAGLVVLPPSPAAAVSTGRPTAVTVAADGTSYVGFASGGRLLRITPAGQPDGSVALDRTDPVTALEVDPGGDLWVDYGASVSELDPDGTLLTHFAHDPGGSCPADSAHDPATYGGLEVTADAVYIAGRCRATVGVYGTGGDLEATIDLPGTGLPRGIAMAPAYQGLPARLYVSVPDAGKVYAYNAGSLRSEPKPAKTLVIQQHYGYRDPEPGAVVVDEKGQLGVVDVANNAVYFYNGPEDYWFYRALGHPPDPASDRGFLDRPTSLDNVGDSFKTGLWIADSGNGRIQRWDHIGTTDWMADAMPPGDPGAPVNTAAPAVTGAPFSGRTLTCSTGAWDGSPASYAVSWQRDGLPVGSSGATYTVTPADVGSELTCVVTATGADGTTSAPISSEGFPIPGADSPPYVVEKPAIQGRASSGSVLRCDPGTWTDDHPTSYLWGWLRDGQLIAGTNAPQYYVVENDISHQVTCRVAAVNAHGTGKAALSDPVLVQEGDGAGPGAPANQRRPSIQGEPAVGAVLYCDPGTWDNAPTFTYVWRRDGQAMGGTEKDRYEVIADDRGHELTCVVTGTNPSGSDRASSPPVTPRGSVTPGGGGTGRTCRGTASVAINGGAAYARKPYVELRVRAPAGAEAVTISNDATFRRADTRPLTRSCGYRWTLDRTSSRTPKVVRVRFVGATSAGTVSDEIVLDAAAPRLKKVAAHWSRGRWAWVLTISASDVGSGLAEVQVGKSRSTARTLRWGRPVTNADSSQLRWVRVLDRAGNASGWYHLSRF
ncbi:uncharacterized protein (Precursor) [Nocardioides sp. PD653]|nr:uncharacterized protein (Precursor) [Nocardioides sp. PD653-B2]GAW52825.1 uncharacterized protein (Precursor) [Nocardioides sp. PD653]